MGASCVRAKTRLRNVDPWAAPDVTKLQVDENGEPTHQTFEATVPQGVTAGDTFQVRTPTGSVVTIVVPPNVEPGTAIQFRVEVKRAAPAAVV